MQTPSMDPGEDSILRDCESQNLWALPETVLCALRGCVACAYKLIVTAPTIMDSERLQPKCHKNLRPETCPRQRAAGRKPKAGAEDDASADSDAEDDAGSDAGAKEEVASQGLYRPTQRILVLGDGDFTFSLALAKSLGPDADLLCTSFQAAAEVTSIYKDAVITLAALGEFPKVKVQHDVDATFLADSLSSGDSFDRVIFNFPCVPDDVGLDGQVTQLPANKALVRGALLSAAPFLRPSSGQVHVVHKTREPFCWWGVPKLLESDATLEEPTPKLGEEGEQVNGKKKGKAKKAKARTRKAIKEEEEQQEQARKACVTCKFERSVVFDRSVYPGYVPRKVGENKSFPVFDAVTYCFVQVHQGAEDAGDVGAEDGVRVEEEDASTQGGLMSPEVVRAAGLVKLNERRMRQVVGLLQLSAADKFPSIGNKKRHRTEAVAAVKKHVTKKMKRRSKKRSGKTKNA